MSKMTIGFIGVGTMGSAIVKAVAENAGDTVILLSNRTREKAEKIAEGIWNATVVDNEEVAEKSDMIFLGVKPQNMAEVLQGIAPVLASKKRKEKPVLVSMAAGLTMEDICRMAGGNYSVIRMMPNMPVKCGAGVVTFCGMNLPRGTVELFRNLLSSVGVVDEISESLMDAATALSGCGPAFACIFAEALADGAVACGLPRSKALLYAAQTLEGTARMLRLSGEHPAELKDAVCSPGGSTIAGVRAMEDKGVRAGAIDAVVASFEKSKQLR